MYPDHDLTRLAARQAELRGRIAASRTQCAAHATKVVRPLLLLDRVVDFWRRLSPLALVAAVPIGFIAQRFFRRRLHRVRTGWRWGSLLFGAGRLVLAAVKAARRPGVV